MQLHRLQADSLPRGTMSTGFLQGLVHTAQPRFFCLPRVYADDVTAAQPAEITSSAHPVPTLHPSTLPRNIGRPEFPETGWERIKDLFNRDETQKYPEEVAAVMKYGAVGALAGFVYGGLPAARLARQRYIQISQAEVYTGRVEAVRSAHNAAIRGFIRYGWRWSWRVSLIVTLFSSVTTGLSLYTDTDAVGHYAAAGAVTAGLFRLNLGLRGLVAGTVIGAALGIPVGGVVIGLQALTGESVCERRRRKRRELYEHKLAEWTARLQMTDDLISNLTVSSQAEETHKDMQRIHELLSSPSNEDASRR